MSAPTKEDRALWIAEQREAPSEEGPWSDPLPMPIQDQDDESVDGGEDWGEPWFGRLFGRWLQQRCVRYVPESSWVPTERQPSETRPTKFLVLVSGLHTIGEWRPDPARNQTEEFGGYDHPAADEGKP